MALETGTFISDLVVTNPTGSDALAFADDHLRLLKSTIKTTFPSVTGAVTATHTQLNTVPNLAPLASPPLTGVPTAPTAAVGSNTTQLATTAFVNAEIANDAPTKTGSGASGSWAISITGNATTATSATTAGNGGVTSVNGATGAVVVSPPTTSNVLAALAGTTAGVVGSYAFMSCADGSIVGVGAARAGSSLRYRSAQCAGGRFGSGNYVETRDGGGAAGTWILMGYIEGYFEYGGVNTNHTNCPSLWLRVS